MIKPGLVSVTFRQLKTDEIIQLVEQAQLDCIEWGGDVHVPHGEEKTAQDVAAMTRNAGLRVAAYGSYYRVAESENQGLSFNAVLASALALEAPVIRVWAGQKGSALADADYRTKVADDSIRIADIAQKEGIKIAYEYHSDTLTDTNESAQQLIKDVDHSNILSYWQPTNGKDKSYCLEGLEKLLPKLCNLHVFHWTFNGENREQFPLSAGENVWLDYLKLANTLSDDRDAMLEFVKNNSPEQFLQDAATLKNWLDELK